MQISGRLLDISGEPGFFARDARSDGIDVTVTAFADNVAAAIVRNLGVQAMRFDFNADEIVGRYDAVTSRWGIGFCVDVPQFFRRVRAALSSGGLFVVQYSPASKAICSRWMFDDYTYLRAYTREWLVSAAAGYGLTLHAVWDDGSYRWNDGLRILRRLIAGTYRLDRRLRGSAY